MKKINFIIIILLVSLSVQAQQEFTEFRNKSVSYYKDINSEILRYAQPVYPDNFLLNAKVEGAAFEKGMAETKIVESDHGKAVQVSTKGEFIRDRDIEIRVKNNVPFLQNDLLYLSFWVRCTKNSDPYNQGYARVYIEENDYSWKTTLNQKFVFNDEWTFIRIPFRVLHRNFPIDMSSMVFALGYTNQTIEIADAKMTNLGPWIKKEDVPSSFNTYSDRSKDAAWRKETSASINSKMKAPLTLKVGDGFEKLADANVSLKLVSSNVKFGIDANHIALAHNPPGYKDYVNLVKENFNAINFTIDPKVWNSYSADTKNKNVQNAIDDLKSNNIESNIVLDFNNKDFAKDISSFLKNVSSYLVYNVSSSSDINSLKKNGAKVIVNIGNINKMASLADIKKMISNGADAISISLEIGAANILSIESISSKLEELSKAGVDVYISDLSLMTTDSDLQKDYISDIYLLALSKKYIKGVFSKNLWENQSAYKEIAWCSFDLSKNASFLAFDEIQDKVLVSSIKGKTNANGELKTDAMVGTYQVTVNGKKLAKTIEVQQKGSVVNIELEN